MIILKSFFFLILFLHHFMTVQNNILENKFFSISNFTDPNTLGKLLARLYDYK